jgi:hypothetical protein
MLFYDINAENKTIEDSASNFLNVLSKCIMAVTLCAVVWTVIEVHSYIMYSYADVYQPYIE